MKFVHKYLYKLCVLLEVLLQYYLFKLFVDELSSVKKIILILCHK